MENEVFEATLSTPETVEATLTTTDRPFLSTPLDDYSVTEGLLLIIALLLIFGWLWKQVKEIF